MKNRRRPWAILSGRGVDGSPGSETASAPTSAERQPPNPNLLPGPPVVATGQATWAWPPWSLLDLVIALIGGRELGRFASWMWREIAPALDPTWPAPIVEAIGALLGWAGVCFAVWVMLRCRRASWASIGFGSLPWRTVALMPLVAVALFALLGLIVVLLKILFGNIAWQAASMATLAMVSPIDLVWTTNPLIGAPLTEEIVFRGVLYRWLRGRLAVRSAILVTTTLFTLSHLLYGFPLPRLLPILVLGLALAVTVERTRSLYPAIALHFWYNLLAVALYLLPTLRG